MESWLTDTPFTKEQIHSYNSFSFYDIDINNEFNKEIKAREKEVFETLDKLNVKDVPEHVNQAFRNYRKALYNYYLEYARNKNYYPSPMVVGPSKYPFHRKEKAMRQLDNIMARINEAKERFEKQIKPVFDMAKQDVKRRQFEDFYNRWIHKAINMKSTQFVDDLVTSLKQRQMEKSPDSYMSKNMDDPYFTRIYQQEARKQRKLLLDEAEKRGLYIPPGKSSARNMQTERIAQEIMSRKFYRPPELFPVPEQLEFIVKGEAKKPRPLFTMKSTYRLPAKQSFKTPIQREMFRREQLELFGYNPLKEIKMSLGTIVGHKEECWKVNTIYGHYDACWTARSTSEKGIVKITAYDKQGYYMPRRSGEQGMFYEDFGDLMYELEAEGRAKLKSAYGIHTAERQRKPAIETWKNPKKTIPERGGQMTLFGRRRSGK